jgi:hypothetical protein
MPRRRFPDPIKYQGKCLGWLQEAHGTPDAPGGGDPDGQWQREALPRLTSFLRFG